MPVKFVFVFAWRQAWIKGRNKMPVKFVFVLCTVIEVRRRNEKLGLGLCTVVDIVKPGKAFGLGKTSVTIWTIGSLENWGNHWVKWTILRSFRATWVTLPDCIGGVTWQHILPGRFLQIDHIQFDRLNLCCQVQDNFWIMINAKCLQRYTVWYIVYIVWCTLMCKCPGKKGRGEKRWKG